MKVVRYSILLSLVFLFNMARGQMRVGGTIYVNDIPANRAEGRVLHSSDDTRTKPIPNLNPNIVTYEVDSFAPVFADALIDTFWAEFKFFSSRDSSYWFKNMKGIKRKYLSIFKTAYGGYFHTSDPKKFIMTDTVLHTRTAQLLCKGVSDKDDGILEVYFDIGEKNGITLQKINFIPFDHSQNEFIGSICRKEIDMIKSGQIDALLDTITRYNSEEKKLKTETLAKDLRKIKMKSNSLFTSRVYVEKGELWVIGIYDTTKDYEHLLLGYKLVGSKFKPATVEVTKESIWR